jgi:hypothetical protein
MVTFVGGNTPSERNLSILKNSVDFQSSNSLNDIELGVLWSDDQERHVCIMEEQWGARENLCLPIQAHTTHYQLKKD